MLGFLFRAAFKSLVAAACIYFTVFVKLGSYTLYEHMRRIGKTPEAQDLGTAVVSAVGSARDELEKKTGNPVRSALKR